MKVLAISGSLRRDSYNTSLLRAAQELAPAGMEIQLFPLDDIPLYNDDDDKTQRPGAVLLFRAALEESDALLIASPEYNHSVTGVLKNAIDWASRGKPSPLDGKPVAIVSAATGHMGGVRGQEHLRLILSAVNAWVVNRPSVVVGNARQKFDAQGRFMDVDGRKFYGQLLVALQKLTERLQATAVPALT